MSNVWLVWLTYVRKKVSGNSSTAMHNKFRTNWSIRNKYLFSDYNSKSSSFKKKSTPERSKLRAKQGENRGLYICWKKHVKTDRIVVCPLNRICILETNIRLLKFRNVAIVLRLPRIMLRNCFIAMSRKKNMLIKKRG